MYDYSLCILSMGSWRQHMSHEIYPTYALHLDCLFYKSGLVASLPTLKRKSTPHNVGASNSTRHNVTTLVHWQNSIPNLVKSKQILIVFTLFRLISLIVIHIWFDLTRLQMNFPVCDIIIYLLYYCERSEMSVSERAEQALPD